MTVYNKASLVLAESPAYKAGKIQPYYPLTPDVSFDFTRATSATRVNASGNIEKETQNLLLQSNQFDTTWTESGSTGIITSGFAGYDGSNDAWQLEHKASQYTSIRQSVSTSGTQTFSCYAKAGTLDYIILYAGTPRAWFNVSSGVVGSTTSTIDASITSVGGGWYRCSITFDGSITTARIYPNDASGTFGTTTGTIYIQDAQLEQGLVARNYQETTTAAFYGGITDNIPRLDYTDSSCPSVLLEPQRTNLIGQSEYLVSINGGSVEYNSSTSPEGLQNATKVIFGASVNDGATMNLSASCSGNTQYTWSAYVKNISGTGLFNIRIDTDTTTILVNQDITATSEWTRVSHTFTTDASATSFGSNSRYRSDADGNEILIWGAQIEEGSYPTSYIPNHSGGSVTRDKDTINEFTLPSSIEGDFTIFIDTREFLASHKFIQFKATDGTLTYAFYSFSNHYDVYNGSAFIVDTSADANGKIVLKQSGSSVKIFVNGVDKTKSGATANAIGIAKILVSQTSLQNNTAALNQMLLFPTALSDAECITLTTL